MNPIFNSVPIVIVVLFGAVAALLLLLGIKKFCSRDRNRATSISEPYVVLSFPPKSKGPKF